jgi:hypothetical protein
VKGLSTSTISLWLLLAVLEFVRPSCRRGSSTESEQIRVGNHVRVS